MTILSAIILTAYLVYVYSKVGVPNCLSDTAYSVSKPLFAVTMITVSALMWLPLMEATADKWQYLVFLSFAGIAILAVSPYKDSDFNYKLHYVGTCIAMVAVLNLWAVRGVWIVPISAISVWLELRAITDKWLLWVELMMFTLAITYTIN